MRCKHGSHRHGDLWRTALSDRFALKYKEELTWVRSKAFLIGSRAGDAEDDYEEDMSRQPRSEEPATNSVPSSYENRSYDHSYSSATVENTVSQPRHESLRDNKVVSINTTSKLAVVLVKPDRFEQAAEIADHLKDKRTVVLNLEQTNKDIARRLVDFLSGVAYANEGKIKKVANSTYIITPYNVDIMGDLIDEAGKQRYVFLRADRACDREQLGIYFVGSSAAHSCSFCSLHRAIHELVRYRAAAPDCMSFCAYAYRAGDSAVSESC